MPGKHEPDESDLRPRAETLDPEDPDGPAHRARDGEPDDDGDREHRVARRPNPLPSREEEDEEELAEADILEEHDLDLDDLEQMEGPDA